MKSLRPDQLEVDTKKRNVRGQAQDGHRSGRATRLAVFLSLAVAGAIVAILVFRVSPLTIAVAGFIALHPLLHFVGGHGHQS